MGIRTGKKVFTTGQIARLCKVAQRTVAKWFDSGRLRGYRIPGSQDRRIPREHLIQFMKEHGMPLGELEEEEWYKVLLIGTEKLLDDRIKELLPASDKFLVEAVDQAFDAGLVMHEWVPDAMVIDLSLGHTAVRRIADRIRGNPQIAHAMLVVLVGEDCDTAAVKDLTAAGYDEVFVRPFDYALVADAIRCKLEME